MRGFAALTKFTDPRVPKWYTGIVTAQNDDGSYQVIVNELNTGYPRIYRTGPDRRRLLPRDRVTIRHTGVVLEIV